MKDADKVDNLRVGESVVVVASRLGGQLSVWENQDVDGVVSILESRLSTDAKRLGLQYLVYQVTVTEAVQVHTESVVTDEEGNAL